MSMANRPLFFSIRKNTSYFTWKPYEEFFNFSSVCIEALDEHSFILYKGDCLKVQQLGRKYLVYAAKYKMLKNGIYLLTGEEGEKYIFKLIKPLQKKA